MDTALSSDTKNIINNTVRVVLGLSALIITGGALYFLWNTFHLISFKEIHDAIAAISFARLAISFSLIILAYFVMTGYDTFGLRQAGSHLSYRKIAFVSFIGDTFNANMGLSAIVGSAVKLRLYHKYGEKSSIILRSIGTYTIGYWAGLALLTAILGSFCLFFNTTTCLSAHTTMLAVLTGIAVVVSILYIVFCLMGSTYQTNVTLLSVLPCGANGLKLLLIGIADWVCSALAFFILLPGTASTDFPPYAVGYLFSHTLGIVSQAPGGLGVFDGVLLYISQGTNKAAVIAAIIVFRLFFYIIPFTIAFLMLLLKESTNAYKKISVRWSNRNEAASRAAPAPVMPSVSIVIPAFNEEISLPSCLNAINSQNYGNIREIIVVDNASTDATSSVALAYGCMVLYEPVKGYNHAVKKGFDEASGEIIVCTDADTIVPPNWVSELVKNLIQQNAVACGGVFRFKDGSYWLRFIGSVFGRLNYHIAGANMAVWKHAYDSVGGFSLDVNLGADVELGLRLKKIGKVVIDRSIVVATSSRRFASAFWATVIRYYVNDLNLYLFNKPVFYSFRDYRLTTPRIIPGRFVVPAMAALLIVFLSSAVLELPFNQIMGPVFAKGNKSFKEVALTFDDGPGISTDAILDILKARGVKATFFIIGKNAQAHPRIVRRIMDEGHEIGNHTFSHPIETAIASPRKFKLQLDSAESIIRNITGTKTTLFRPPHGWRNPWMLRECTANGYEVVMWSIDSHDWRTKSVTSVTDQVFRRVHPGSIILFHDRLNTDIDKGMEHTVQALPQIIDSLSRAGYSFVTISQMNKFSPNPGYVLHARKVLKRYIHTITHLGQRT